MKLLAVNVSLVLGVAALLATYLSSSHVADMRAQLEAKALTYARFTGKQVESAVSFNDRETAREVFDSLSHEDQDVESLTLFTARGTILHARGALSSDAPADARRAKQVTPFQSGGRVGVAVPVVSLEGPRGTLVLELSTRRLSESRSRVLVQAAVAGGAAVLAGALGALLIARSLARRLGAIASVAEAVAKGDLGQPPLKASTSGDEIEALARAFNAMLRQLQDLIGQIRESARAEQDRLETEVRARTAELAGRNDDMRRVLDNVGQGFFILDRQGRISSERSAVLEAWFGPAPASGLFADYLGAVEPATGEWFVVCWESVLDGLLPLSVTVGQLPRRLSREGQHFELDYRPLLTAEGELERVVVVISDVTAEKDRERAETDERELTRLFTRLVDDRPGLSEFFAEADALVDGIRSCRTGESARGRFLHTLKGNAGLFGIESVATLAHALEDCLAEKGKLSDSDLEPLVARWSKVSAKVRSLIGHERSIVEVDVAGYHKLIAAVEAGTSRVRLREMLIDWQLEPTQARLRRMAEQAEALAERLGKGPVRVGIEGNGLRLAGDQWRPFWTAAVHVVRNAVDHGLESAEERPDSKPEARLEFRTRADADTFAVELSDNGRGIAWERVKAKASSLGLPAQTHADLIKALFADGMSTRDIVSEVSGRGIGLGAAQQACEELGGRVEVTSEQGRGTTIRFVWPAQVLLAAYARPIQPSHPPTLHA